MANADSNNGDRPEIDFSDVAKPLEPQSIGDITSIAALTAFIRAGLPPFLNYFDDDELIVRALVDNPALLDFVHEQLRPELSKHQRIAERLAQEPEMLDYTNSRAFFDSTLPQIYRLDVVNGLREQEHAVTLRAEIVGTELECALHDVLISDLAMGAGFENGKREIVDAGGWKEFFDEITPSAWFKSAAAASYLNFMRNAPQLLGAFYVLALKLSVVAGARESNNIASPGERQNMEQILITAVEREIDGFRGLVKDLLETKRGRYPKVVPSVGSELSQAVEDIGMQFSGKGEDGKIFVPGLARIALELNRLPEYQHLRRRVLKGGNKRRLFNANSLSQRLIEDKSPWGTVIKKRLVANLS